MVANLPSPFFALAAEPLPDAGRGPRVTHFLTSPSKPLAQGFRSTRLGRKSRRRRFSPIFMPGWRACGYGTATGRAKWASTDSNGEKGGLNLYDFLGNDGINSADVAGRQMALRVVREKLPVPPTSGPFSRYLGLTWFDQFAPTITLAARWGKCCWEIRFGGIAVIYYWWTTPVSLDHELEHFQYHRDTVYDYNLEAASLAQGRRSLSKAQCLGRVILGALKDYHFQWNVLRNLELDQDYRGGEIPDAKARLAQRQNQLIHAIQTCERIP